MDNLLPLLVAIPLGAAFFIPMVSRKAGWVPDVLGNLTMLCLAIMSLLTLSPAIMGKPELIYHVGAWRTPIGIDLRLDGLAALMLIAVNVIGLSAGAPTTAA